MFYVIYVSFSGLCDFFLDFEIHSLKLTANAPENRPKPKRKRESIPTIHFQVLLLLVSGRVSPTTPLLVGGFNPFEKYARQIGSFPQVGVKIKNIWNHHLALVFMIPPEGLPAQDTAGNRLGHDEA